MVEDTTGKPSPPIYIGGPEFLASTVVEVQEASTSVERTGFKYTNPLILAGISGVLASIVDGSIGALPCTNPRSKIRDVVMDVFVKAPLEM
jgi:hypothetical protein